MKLSESLTVQAQALIDASDAVRSHSPGGPIPNLTASQATGVREWLRARATRLQSQAEDAAQAEGRARAPMSIAPAIARSERAKLSLIKAARAYSRWGRSTATAKNAERFAAAKQRLHRAAERFALTLPPERP